MNQTESATERQTEGRMMLVTESQTEFLTEYLTSPIESAAESKTDSLTEFITVPITESPTNVVLTCHGPVPAIYHYDTNPSLHV